MHPPAQARDLTYDLSVAQMCIYTTTVSFHPDPVESKMPTLHYRVVALFRPDWSQEHPARKPKGVGGSEHEISA